MSENVRELVAKLKEAGRRLADEASLEQLANGPTETPQRLDLWALTPAELDQEMASRLSSLNEDIDCRPHGEITSHRRRGGWLIVAAKRLLRWLATPYSDLLFARQRRFNEDLVAFHLAAFIRQRRFDERLRDLDRQLDELRNAGGADTGAAPRP